MDSEGDVGRYTSIAIDSLDSVHISYYDGTKGDLKYATKRENSPPTTPHLLSPEDNQNDLGTTVEFKWEECTDADNDSVHYKLSVCEDSEFTSGCFTNNDIASLDNKGTYSAGTGISLLLFAIVFTGGIRRRKNVFLKVSMIVLASWLFISCGSSTDSGNITISPENGVTSMISGLSASTTYYWKVTATDNKGGVTDSEIRSFTTQ